MSMIFASPSTTVRVSNNLYRCKFCPNESNVSISGLIFMGIRFYKFTLFVAWLVVLIWVALELDKMQFFKF